ncbi:hypothetical protein [Oceanispirochaeta sp.]|jgi:hypothetical protein|uniref:hypothetical protein n=1 Tax=Oceanispirochaeta sp. TaxID=2035350 RepID=UPI00263710D7|nr:hypothetical protein [Oceanispirochaeta sp.]MDA3957220.1 hypothetical protein [Oceanispirochaeta sp.]
MKKELWFLTQDDELVDVYDDRDIATEERIYLKEDNPLDTIRLHSIGIAELSNYPDEYEFAQERGLLDE